MLFHPAMYGLFSFCVGSVICAGASQLRPRGYPRYIVMTLGVALVLAGIWLAFFGYSFLF